MKRKTLLALMLAVSMTCSMGAATTAMAAEDSATEENAEAAAARAIPTWLAFNPETMSGNVVTVPIREQIEVPVNEQLVVEFYAR